MMQGTGWSGALQIRLEELRMPSRPSVRSRVLTLCSTLTLVTLAGCGGDSDDASVADEALSTPAADAATEIAHPDQPDPELAAQGEILFTQRACASCHTIGRGRLVGPDLLGVTDRREPEWTMSMIVNPDWMLQTDSIARRLFSEYFTPMVNQNLSHDEATALYHFLLSNPDTAGSSTTGN